MLIDSHCHLDFEQLSSNIEAVLERAHNNDVKILQTICTKIKDFPKVLAIAEQYSNIFASVGIHPHEVESEPHITTEQLVEFTKHNKIIGIGETGLDYYYEHSPRELQVEMFKRHIEVARLTQLPIIIHTRSADEDTIDILKKEMNKGSFPGLIHCFSSSANLASAVLDLGLYISISGIITFNKAEELREIVKNIPLDRLIIETDSPYLAPIPMRGKTNEPSFVKYVAEKIAEIKNTSYEVVAEQTTSNFLKLFQKVKI